MPKTESQTRREIIDQRLIKAGWNPDDPTLVSIEFDIDLRKALGISEPATKYSGHQYVDYLLLGKDGKPLAVVEAKRTSKDAELGREQGKQYANNLVTVHSCDLPFVLYTNGHDIYFWDTTRYPPRKVYGFPTRDDLESLHFIGTERRPLSVEMIDPAIAGRPYQIEAIRTVLEGIEHSRRKFLLVMATGTGKTRTCMGLIDVLTRARWAKRILFLVDRIALRDQALEAFKDHLPNAPVWPKSGEKDFAFDRRVYTTTYPTMLNLIRDPNINISPFFFDLIIADESHRSIYNVYKDVLGYFDALQLGLTATPTDHIDHDTFDTFDCDNGIPTFAYTYEQAIHNVPPYLCDFRVLQVQSKFQIDGIRGRDLSPSAKKRLIEEGKDPDLIDFEGTELERTVTNSGTNKLIVREFMEESIKDADGVLPGKSIIFAISKAHARRLQETFDALYPQYHGELAKVIVSEDPRAHGKGGLLDQFKNKDMPRVAISVDMLDTGIDIREVVNLVFAKPVFSFTKFWQMIGRGTRVLEEDPSRRKPWCTEKEYFLIIDCWRNFEHFKITPQGVLPGAQTPLPVRLFRARIAKLRAALQNGRADIAERIKKDLRDDIAALPEKSIVVMDAAANLETVRDDAFWLRMAPADIDFLANTIAPLMRMRSAADFKAMRFETDLLDLATAELEGNTAAFEAVKNDVLTQIAELPLNVNIVAAERELIEAAQTPFYWSKVTEDRYAELAGRLAPLMKRRRQTKTPIEKLRLNDITAVKEYIEFGPEHERLTTTAYRKKVEAFIHDLESRNTALIKLKAGLPVGEREIAELARLLEESDPFATEEILRKVYDNRTATFIQFIRHILGIEPLRSWSETIGAAFDEYIGAHTELTARQIQFLQTLRTYILQNGTIRKENLIDAPFTLIHPEGIRGIFPPAQVEELVRFAQGMAARGDS